MIGNESGQQLIGLIYFDSEGAKRLINKIHVALGDCSLRLVWQSGLFLVVTPEVVWATEFPKYLNVQSNVNWTIENY